MVSMARFLHTTQPQHMIRRRKEAEEKKRQNSHPTATTAVRKALKRMKTNSRDETARQTKRKRKRKRKRKKERKKERKKKKKQVESRVQWSHTQSKANLSRSWEFRFWCMLASILFRPGENEGRGDREEGGAVSCFQTKTSCIARNAACVGARDKHPLCHRLDLALIFRKQLQRCFSL